MRPKVRQTPRTPLVIHTTSMDQATVLICHVLAFHYFGGAPSIMALHHVGAEYAAPKLKGRLNDSFSSMQIITG